MSEKNDLSTLLEKLTEIVKDATLVDKANEALSMVLSTQNKQPRSCSKNNLSVVKEAVKYAFDNTHVVESVEPMPSESDDVDAYVVELSEKENDLYGPTFDKLSAYLLLRNVHLSNWYVHISEKTSRISILLMIDKSPEELIQNDSQKTLDLELYPENDLLLQLISYMINKEVGSYTDHPEMSKARCYRELTTELADHVIEMIEASKDIDIEYVSMPFRDYKEWGDAEKDELKKHVGEVVEITKYGSPWSTIMTDKIFPDGAEITLTNELFATAGELIVEDSFKWIQDCNILKWAMDLAKANKMTDDTIFELFKDSLSFGEKKHKEKADRAYKKYLKEESTGHKYDEQTEDAPPF